MLRTFGNPVATCYNMFGVVGPNLEMVKFFMQHFWMLHDVVVVWRRLWPGPVATHRNRVTKRAQHVAPDNVAICCVQMLRSLGQVLRRRSSVSYCMLEFPASKLVFVCFKKIAFRNIRATALKLKVNCVFQVPPRAQLSDLIVQWIS